MNREELLKVARPILFNTEMVRAILDGRKSVTRRVVKPQPPNDAVVKFEGGMEVAVDEKATSRDNRPLLYVPKFLPYRIETGKGDILYVRETWCNINRPDIEPEYYYLADMKYVEDYDSSEWKWKPSIHMPKKAARIFLKVTDVRVERLQDITEEQAIKEGVKDPYDYMDPWFYEGPSMEKLTYHIAAFAGLWFSILPKYYQNYMAWESNPWVWVIEFERVLSDEYN